MSKLDFEAARQVLKENPRVVAAWVFGSAKEGISRPGGDVDIAVLFDQPPSLEDRLDLLLELQKALDFEDIDLVVLNNASAITRFEAVSGPLLYSRDPQRQAEFVSLTAREYEDSMAFIHWGMKNRP